MISDQPITKRLIKEIASLDSTKGRRKAGLFVAEGTKCVLDLGVKFQCRYLFATQDWLEEHQTFVEKIASAQVFECGRGQLGEMTRLTNTPPVIAAFGLPAEEDRLPECAPELIVALDGVQDPGNMGTIIRTCDWMGVRTIVASNDTVDCFNPKTVQATMGALARVGVVYTDLPEWLNTVEAPVYGTFLDGENIYRMELTTGGVIVMGNEGHGISAEVASRVNRRIFIPSFPPEIPTSESLNVATATAITLSEFRSRIFKNNG